MMKTPLTLHICMCSDVSYLRHCAVTILSVLDRCPKASGHIIFHLMLPSKLDFSERDKLDIFTRENHINLMIHPIDETLLEGVKFRENRPLSKAAYYRLLLSSVLPEDVHTVLYLDSDILVLRDLTDLFSLDISNYALAATKDISGLNDEHRFQLQLNYMQSYFCSGMMYVNLDYWRCHHVEEQLLEFARRERKVFYHDQDALNFVFKGRWFRLSPVWNRFYPYFYHDNMFEGYSDRYEMEHTPRIIHFFHYFKPWNEFKISGKEWNVYRKLYDDYLAKTPWKGFPKSDSHLKDQDCYEKYRRYKWESLFYKINMHGFYNNLQALLFKLHISL